jgi:hypothetical protein
MVSTAYSTDQFNYYKMVQLQTTLLYEIEDIEGNTGEQPKHRDV